MDNYVRDLYTIFKILNIKQVCSTDITKKIDLRYNIQKYTN